MHFYLTNSGWVIKDIFIDWLIQNKFEIQNSKYKNVNVH